MMGFECRAVYYSFVKDEPIPFHELTDVTVFGVWVVFEDLTRNRDVTSLVLRVNEIIVHDIVVELLTTRDIESEPTVALGEFLLFLSFTNTTCQYGGSNLPSFSTCSRESRIPNDAIHAGQFQCYFSWSATTPTNFTTLFPCVGDVTVIFRASRCELDDVFTF